MVQGAVAVWYSAVCSAVLACFPILYFLWKHHPSYGANPGAPHVPLLGCLPFILLNKHRFYEWTCELFDRSPSLTRRIVLVGGETLLSTADPGAVKHILKDQFAWYHKGPSFHSYFADLLGDGIFNCDGPLWRFQRKIASHEFTSNSLKDFVIAVARTEIRGRLLPALDSSAATCRSSSWGCGSVDLQAVLMLFTFDTACQLTFGADPACLDGHAIAGALTQEFTIAPTSYMKVPHDLIQGFVRGFQEALGIVAERFLVPRFIWKTKRFLKVGSEQRLARALEAVGKFTDFVIEQSRKDLIREDGNKERKDLLARFMRLSEPQVESLLEGQDEAVWKSNRDDEHGQVLSDSLLKGILLSFILAGREAVVSGVTFMMWLLCNHPRVEKGVLDEIEGILRDRDGDLHAHDAGSSCSPASAAEFSYEEVKRMNYMHAALSESMRLYPPVPLDPKYAARDDTLPDGTRVSKGDRVSYNAFAMGRAERVWGKDCLQFRPERWLGEDKQFIPAASPYKYPVFQAGPRVCLGKDFAFIQMKLLLASLLREFEFAVEPGFKPSLSFGVNMTMVNGLPLRVKRRRQDFWAARRLQEARPACAL